MVEYSCAPPYRSEPLEASAEAQLSELITPGCGAALRRHLCELFMFSTLFLLSPVRRKQKATGSACLLAFLGGLRPGSSQLTHVSKE